MTPGIVFFGLATGEVVPYGNGYRGEYDEGDVTVMTHSGYPGIVKLLIDNTDSRCPPGPTKEDPARRADVLLSKSEAIKLRDFLDAAIATLSDEVM